MKTQANHTVYSQCASSIAQSEQRDCGVRALAVAACVDYETAHAALTKAGRGFRAGTTGDMMQHALDSMGLDVRPALIKANWRYTGYRWRCARPSIAQFVRENPRGHYVVFLATHAIAVVDGVVHDWTVRPRSRRQVWLYWKLV